MYIYICIYIHQEICLHGWPQIDQQGQGSMPEKSTNRTKTGMGTVKRPHGLVSAKIIVVGRSTYAVNSNPEQYESQWERLAHILWKINMFQTTNQLNNNCRELVSRCVYCCVSDHFNALLCIYCGVYRHTSWSKVKLQGQEFSLVFPGIFRCPL